MTREFMTFLKQYGVIGLAIAVIIGGKAAALVSALVGFFVRADRSMPLLSIADVKEQP